MTQAQAEAGRRGDDVRSDCWISLEPTSSGGINLSLTSKVDGLYSDKIRALLTEGLAHFGIEHAKVDVEDQGALPFVQMARLEAAVRRLGRDEPTKPWLPEAQDTVTGTDRRRPRRSRLYLPGNEPKFMINAALHRPDGLILDLEDSVAPAEKDAARLLVRNALVALPFESCERMVRINQGERGLDDLEDLVPYGVELILVPKVESADSLRTVDEKLQSLRAEHGIDYPIWLMPIIESARGAWFALDIAEACASVSSLAIGLEDYTADIGAQRTQAGHESFWARAQVVNGAKAAGVQAIDTVFSDVGDMDGLRASVVEAKSLGFEGKGCIHPRQIDVVHEGFAPTPDEIGKAKRIVLAFEDAEKRGLGVVSLGSKMIDPPVVKRALHTVATAEREGLLVAEWRSEG
ncbi:citrate lyase ACP [bacterium]|nr:citrate lyase ACP [bacterium]